MLSFLLIFISSIKCKTRTLFANEPKRSLYQVKPQLMK